MNNDSNSINSGTNWTRLFSHPDMRDNNGRPSLEAALMHLSDEGERFLKDNFIDTTDIEKAVDTVYEEHPKFTFDLSSLATRALSHLKVVPGTESKVREQVENFVRAQSNLFKNGGAGKYLVSPGRKSATSGGVIRITEEFAAEYRRKQEEKQNKQNGENNA